MTLSYKHQAFVDSYFLHNQNATEAYFDVYGGERESAARSGSRLLNNVEIQAEITRRLAANTMKADEVISRLSDHARGDMQDFLDVTTMGFTVDLSKAKRLGKTSLIKEIRQKVTTIVTKSGDEVETVQTEIKLQDQQAALIALAKYHGLMVDRQDITSGGEPIRMVEITVPPEPNDSGG